jgi:hypothetical protein
MEVSGQLHAPADLPPGKEPLVPVTYEVGWAPEPFWTQWWREKFPASVRIRNPDHPARSPALYHWAIPAPQEVRHDSSLICAVSKRTPTCSLSIIKVSLRKNENKWFGVYRNFKCNYCFSRVICFDVPSQKALSVLLPILHLEFSDFLYVLWTCGT